MKFAMMASVLLLATGLAAQEAGTAPVQASKDSTSFSLPDQGDSCYILKTFHAPRSERMREFSGPVRTTTCTPASRFRVKYLPSRAEARDPKQAKCAECDREARPEENKK